MEKCLRSRDQSPVVEKDSIVEHCVDFVLPYGHRCHTRFYQVLFENRSRRHLEEEKELLGLIDVPRDVLEVPDVRQAIVDIRIAFLLNFMETVTLISAAIPTALCGNIHANCVLLESLHRTRGLVSGLLRWRLSNGTLEDCPLELWRLNQLVDDVEGSQ